MPAIECRKATAIRETNAVVQFILDTDHLDHLPVVLVAGAATYSFSHEAAAELHRQLTHKLQRLTALREIPEAERAELLEGLAS